MPKPIAVLVEDDPEQFDFSARILREHDFDLREFDSIEPALIYMESNTELVDLFVLDRRLPMRPGEPESDEFGDELFQQVRSKYPDARIVVFTGFATIRHLQIAYEGGGQLPARGGVQCNRITVLEKHQSLDFKTAVSAYRQVIQELDDIEILAPSGDCSFTTLEKRTLRRIAYEYGAVSISPTVLSGGLTGACVWKCVLRRAEGTIANIVAKQVRTSRSPGGLPELLPLAHATSTVGTLSGLMGGALVNILQLAGESPVSLMYLLASDPERAARLAASIFAEISAVPEMERSCSIADVCAPLIGWEDLSERLRELDLSCPSGRLRVTVRTGIRHGDLHPANIVIDNGTPVLIDFDSSTFAAGLLDPITALLSTLVHPDSPLRSAAWPSAEEIERDFGGTSFGQGHPQVAWFQIVNQWIDDRRTSPREYWALVLSYCARQLRYDDVRSDEAILERLAIIIRKSVLFLCTD